MSCLMKGKLFKASSQFWPYWGQSVESLGLKLSLSIVLYSLELPTCEDRQRKIKMLLITTIIQGQLSNIGHYSSFVINLLGILQGNHTLNKRHTAVTHEILYVDTNTTLKIVFEVHTSSLGAQCKAMQSGTCCSSINFKIESTHVFCHMVTLLFSTDSCSTCCSLFCLFLWNPGPWNLSDAYTWQTTQRALTRDFKDQLLLFTFMLTTKLWKCD